MTERHSWGLRNPFPGKTERQCVKCGLVKTTFHETDAHGRTSHWTKFFRGLDEVVGKNTPPCPGMSETDSIETERMAAA